MALYNITSRSEYEEKVLKSNKLVLVDFWAQWCPPCRAMAPTLEAVADDMDKTFDVVKVDVEASADNGSLANEHGVQGIPNMQLFQGGKHVDTIIGLVPRPVLEAKLKSLLT
jgi:thioredoxin 1